MPQSAASSRLMVLMFTDVVGSVRFKSQFGTPAFSNLIRRHDELFRRTLGDFGGTGSSILQDTGDGFLASFTTVTAAVRTALAFQQALAIEPWSPAAIAVRIGIQLGEMAEIRPTDSPGGTKFAGLAIDLAARVLSLAGGGQILLTRFAFNEARQFVEGHPSDPNLPLKWVAHGPYLMQGIDEPVEIFEVGVDGTAPLSPPPGNEKARPVVPPGVDETLGWRPALGLEIPGRPGWGLEKKLGEGGFGEVWLGRHCKLHDRRVFKFCFDPDRLRSFKREMTLFRLLRDVLGDRPDIARLHEVKLDQSPFFLESEYTDGGNLSDWAAAKGGIEKVPLPVRMDLVTRITDAVAAAHSVAILHKDIKPSNILIYADPATEQPRPRLADFGIGMLTDRSQLGARHITETGFTMLTGNDSSRTGTRMYAPPELLTGRAFSVQGDVYALGILLYQMVVGDLTRPLGAGWERDIDDDLLRQDIAACVDVDPSRRPAGAAELANLLRSADRRRADRLKAATAVTAAKRRKRLALVAGLFAVVAAVATAVSIYSVRQKSVAEKALVESHRQQQIAVEQFAVVEAVSNFQMNVFFAADPNKWSGENLRVIDAIGAALKELDAGRLAGGTLKDHPLAEAAIRQSIGETLESLGRYDEAEKQDRISLKIRREHLPPNDGWIGTNLHDLGLTLYQQGRHGGRPEKLVEARQILGQALVIFRGPGGLDDREAGRVLGNLGLVAMAEQKPDEAEPLLVEALNIARRHNPPGDEEVAGDLCDYGGLLQSRGNLSAAEKCYRAGLAIDRRIFPDGGPPIATSVDDLGSVLFLQGKAEKSPEAAAVKLAEAEKLLEEALSIRRQALSAGHPLLAFPLNNLAMLLAWEKRFKDAEPLLREELRILTRGGAKDPRVNYCATALADLMERTGRAGEAGRLRIDYGVLPPTTPPTTAPAAAVTGTMQ